MFNHLKNGLMIAVSIGLILGASVSYAAGLSGSLEGNVTQNIPRVTFPVKIILYGNVGSAKYPSLNCSGRLDLQRSETDTYWYELTIQYGKDRCVGGSVELQRHPIDKNSWIYTWRGNSAISKGVLYGSVTPDLR